MENYDLHYPAAIIVVIGVLAYFIASIFFNVFAVRYLHAGPWRIHGGR